MHHKDAYGVLLLWVCLELSLFRELICSFRSIENRYSILKNVDVEGRGVDVASVTQNGGIIHLVDKYKQLGGGDDINFLTCEDRYKFLKAAYSSHNYSQYALILETSQRHKLSDSFNPTILWCKHSNVKRRI